VEAMVKFELLVWEYCDSIHSEPMYSHHPCKYVSGANVLFLDELDSIFR
jgi:hypothetical protein